MFTHLREDWPWIVVPMAVVAIVAYSISRWLMGDADPIFTYGL